MDIYRFKANSLEGKEQALDAYRGKALLIVNVASKCGYTPQYKGLESLYRRHKDKGFFVLGFPCDQFGHQEPGDAKEIRQFCTLNYDVTFPLFAKIEVNGPGAHPLYQHLKAQQKEPQDIKWNFAKFLVDKQGKVLKSYSHKDTPESIEKDLVPLLD